MSTYEISKSSLLSLKAEILRKQEELIKTKQENKIKILNIKKNTPLDLKNKGVELREKKDYDPEEEDLLRKSRAILEKKAKMYEKLMKDASKFTDDDREYNRRYLVRFDKKVLGNMPPDDSDTEDVDKHADSDEERHFSDEYEPPKNPDEEWVEYVDCLGRTRKCLRKDLEFLKSKDRELMSSTESKEKGESDNKDVDENKRKEHHEEIIETKETNFTETNELLSSDMRRELLRQQWELEEEALKDKSNIHYQDILFNEARTHGVGYYGFSKDEEERAKQQEALKKLREETEQQQKRAQELRQMREKQLSARAKAARNRKRARMGLPPEEEESKNTTKVEEPAILNEEEENKKKKEETDKEKLLELARSRHVRPWDIGKEGVHQEYTQEEWVDKQRRERNKEFAPPSTYKREFKSDVYKKESSESDKLLYFSTKKSNKESSDKNYKKEEYKRSYKEKTKEVFDYKQKNNIPTKVTPIINECSDDDEEFEETSSRGKGVEIAPPPTFDYYGPSDSKRSKPASKKGNLEDSIVAGLKYLRQQAEKKESSSKHPTEMFLS